MVILIKSPDEVRQNINFVSKKTWICHTNIIIFLIGFPNKPEESIHPDDGGHDVIDNFEFPCNSMENLILIWNFTNTVINNVK